jgi:hypothetical protein
MDVRSQMRGAATYNAHRGLLALGVRTQDRVGVPLQPRNARASHLHMLAHTGYRVVVVVEAICRSSLRITGYGETELLPIAMMGSRQWFAKDVPASSRCPSLSCKPGTGTTNPCGRARSSPSATDRCAASGTTREPRPSATSVVSMPTATSACSIAPTHGDLGWLQRLSVVAVFPWTVACMKTETSVTEKELVEHCARNFASHSGLIESAVSQATDGARGTLARMSQEARSFHRTRWVL